MIFLSWTLVTGEGGMLWLCQITFAGIGAITTAELANNHGWPVLAAVLAGGVVAMVIGLVIGLLSIRLGDLYVALVTLTFGLLVENLVFTLPRFVNSGLGLTLNRPSFATSDRAFAYVCLVAFFIVALFILNFRRSTSGLAMNAVRWSDPGARSTGVSVVQMKVTVAALGAMVAGIGGGLLALQQTSIAAERVRHLPRCRVAGRSRHLRHTFHRRGADGRPGLRHVARTHSALPPDLGRQLAADLLRPRRDHGCEVPRGHVGRAEPHVPRLAVATRITEHAPAFVDARSRMPPWPTSTSVVAQTSREGAVMVEKVP